MGVDIVCYSLLDLVKEGRNFCLGHSLFLFNACRHPLHMHLQGFGSQGCKDIYEVVLAVWCDMVEEEPVLQGTPKYGEGVVGIFGVPVVGRQADGCCPSCQCTSNGISCGLSRLGDELLWGWFWGHVSVLGCQIMVRSAKLGVGYKNGCILGSQSDLLQTGTGCNWGCALPLSGIVVVPMTSQGVQNAFWMFFWPKNTKNKERYNLECVDVLPECSYVLQCPSLVCMNVQFIFTVHPSFLHFVLRKTLSIEAWVPCSWLPPCCEMKWSSYVWIEHIYWNTETYIHSLYSLRSGRHVPREAGKAYIYTAGILARPRLTSAAGSSS